MKDIYEKCILHNLWFKLLSLFSIILIITSFFMPPAGVIDPSVMAGVGEIFAFAALGAVIHAIDKDKTITMSHGDTTITVNGKKYILEEPNIPEE